MVADIEKIKEKFGIGKKKVVSEESIEAVDYGYSSYTFEIFSGDRRVGTITVSDMGDDIRDTMRDFLQELVSNGRIYDTDVIRIVLTSAYPSVDEDEDKDGLIYEGSVKEYNVA